MAHTLGPPSQRDDRDRQAAERDLRSYGRRRGVPSSPRQKALVAGRAAARGATARRRRAADTRAPTVHTAGQRSLAGDRLRRRRAPDLAGDAQSRCRPDRLRAVRGRRRQGAERHRYASDWPTSGSTPTMAGRSCVCCPTRASIALLFCFPTPGPRSGITSAGWFQAKRLPSLPASCVPGGELRIATDIGAYACAILLAVLGTWQFPLDGRGARGLAQASPRLAANPLRGQGPPGGPAVLLFPLPAGLNGAARLRTGGGLRHFLHFLLANGALPAYYPGAHDHLNSESGPFGSALFVLGDPLSIPKRSGSLYS